MIFPLIFGGQSGPIDGFLPKNFRPAQALFGIGLRIPVAVQLAEKPGGLAVRFAGSGGIHGFLGFLVGGFGLILLLSLVDAPGAGLQEFPLIFVPGFYRAPVVGAFIDFLAAGGQGFGILALELSQQQTQMGHPMILLDGQDLVEAAICFRPLLLIQVPKPLFEQKSGIDGGSFLSQTVRNFCGFLLVLQLNRAAGVGKSGQVFPGFQKFSIPAPSDPGHIAAFPRNVLNAKPAQGAAPVGLRVGVVLLEELLILGQGLVEFPGPAQIVAAVVGGGPVRGIIGGQCDGGAASGTDAQSVVREGGDASAAEFAF